MNIRLKDEFMELKNDRLRQHLNAIFNSVYLNQKSTRGSFASSDYVKAKNYVEGAFDTLKTAYDCVYEQCSSMLEEQGDMSFAEQEEYLSSKWNQWIGVFITVYTHPQRASGSWAASDVEAARAYADASLDFVDVLNALVPPQKTAPLESLGL